MSKKKNYIVTNIRPLEQKQGFDFMDLLLFVFMTISLALIGFKTIELFTINWKMVKDLNVYIKMLLYDILNKEISREKLKDNAEFILSNLNEKELYK